MAIPFLSDAKFSRLHKLKFHSTGEITTTGASGTNFDISAIGSNTDLRFLADNDDGSSSVYFLLDASMADYTTPDYYTRFPDNSHLVFGNSANISSLDFEIYHAGTTAYLQGDSSIYIASENLIQLNADSGVELRHNNSRKIHTTTTGVDVTGTINLDNLTINGAQGSDGQVLTSTGSGIAWENASGGASLSGGEANKVAVWSATDTLTHNDNFHFDTTNVRLGIGLTNPSTKLEVAGTDGNFQTTGHQIFLTKNGVNQIFADSSASPDVSSLAFGTNNTERMRITSTGQVGIATTSPAYNLQVGDGSGSKSMAVSSAASSALYLSTPSGTAQGILGFGNSQYATQNTRGRILYQNSTTSASNYMQFNVDFSEIMRLTNSNVGIGTTTPSQKLHVNGNVTANRYYGNTNTSYYLDPNDTGTAIYTAGDIRAAAGKGFTSDGLGKLYAWRAVDNTTSNSTNYVKIARLTGTAGGSDYYSDRCIIELAGRSSSYSNNQLPAMGYIVAQLQSDANWDVVYYNHHNGTDEVVDEVGVVQINNTQADIYVRVGSYAEVTASAHISDGYISVDNTRSGSAPSGYSAANAEYKVWNSGNDGSGSGLDADTLDGQHASAFLTAHPNISGATSQNNTGNGFIQDLTFDSNGHVTGVVSASVSGIPTNNNQLTNGAGYITSSGVAAKIKAGGNGPSTENLNTVADSVSTGQLEYRGFNSSSSNKPSTSDNANGVITVGQHSGNYSAQLAFSSNGNVYWRDNPAGNHGSWRKMWDDGNDGAGSGLDADKLDGLQTTSSGDRWGVVPTVSGSGVLEAGKYIDFHESDSTTSDYNYRITSTSGRLYFSGDIEVDGGDIYINDTNTRITEGNSNSVRLQTNSGYIDVGPQNTSHCHFLTDRSNFYFSKELQVDTGVVRSYNEDLQLGRAGTDDKIQIRSTNIGFFLDGAEDMRLENDGDLHVESDVIAYSTTISDSRLKDDVITIGGALDKVKKLRGVEYTWNKGGRKDQRDIGVIAQEVEEVIPEIVREKKMPLMDDSDTKYKTVDYEKLTAVLIEAVKDQQKQIDELKSIINGGS